MNAAQKPNPSTRCGRQGQHLLVLLVSDTAFAADAVVSGACTFDLILTVVYECDF